MSHFVIYKLQMSFSSKTNITVIYFLSKVRQEEIILTASILFHSKEKKIQSRYFLLANVRTVSINIFKGK